MNFLGVPSEHGNETPTSEKSNAMNLQLSDYEDLGVKVLDDSHVSKRCRYLNPNSTIWPMGFGLITSLYKYKHKKPVILNNYFDTLPEELMLYIFKMLDKRTLTKCAYVCTQWKRIAYDESLWYCLNIPYRRISNLALDSLLKRNIKFLSISHGNVYMDVKNCNMLFNTPLIKLQYLDLSSVFIHVQTLSSLLKQCCNLVKLSIEHCTVDLACCSSIASNTKLKVLNLSSTFGLDIVGLKYILSLKNLEELNIAWANMKNDDLHYLSANIMSSLKRLNISGFLNMLNDSDVISLVYRCPQLIELDISDNLSITSTSLDFILHNQFNLKILSMSRCYNVGSALLQPTTLRMKMGNNIHRLKELNVFGITNQRLFNYLCAYLLEFDINKSMFSHVARPKPAHNEHTIWEIPINIDC